MGDYRNILKWLVCILFLIAFDTNAWAGGKLAVVQYDLTPVEQVDSGKYIKAEWSAKIKNRGSSPVTFSVNVSFLGADEAVLKETSCQCSLSAQETKTFKDTVLLEMSMASQIANTKVVLIEEKGSQDER